MKRSFLIVFLIVFCCLFVNILNTNAYFLETPAREGVYDFLVGGIIVDMIEHGNYLYALQNNEYQGVPKTSGSIIKIDKESNSPCASIVLFNNDCESVKYDSIKVFNDKLYISGVLEQKNQNEQTVYRPLLLESSFDLINKTRYVAASTYPEILYTTLSDAGYYYLAYNDSVADNIYLQRLNVTNLSLLWEDTIEMFSPRLKDIKACGNFVYLSYTKTENDILWSKIIKYNKDGALINVGGTMAKYQAGIFTTMKIDPGYNRIIIAEHKSSFTGTELDEICIKTYDTINIMFYKSVIINISGIVQCVTIANLEEDIYVSMGIYRLLSQYPYTPYESYIKFAAIEGVDMSVKRIIDKAPRNYESGLKKLVSCIYTRDEVYLISKNGTPIAQKRLSLIESFDSWNDKLKFHDFWVPKTTLAYFDASGTKLSSLNVELYGIRPYVDWVYTRIIWMNDTGNLVSGTQTSELYPCKGYWVFQGHCRHVDPDCDRNYDYEHIAIAGKEILWHTYNSSNYNQLIGVGTYPGLVFGAITGDPVFMYEGTTFAMYSDIPLIGGLTAPGRGYKVGPQMEPYVFVADQIEY